MREGEGKQRTEEKERRKSGTRWVWANDGVRWNGGTDGRARKREFEVGGNETEDKEATRVLMYVYRGEKRERSDV